jgi:hypothetical protein
MPTITDATKGKEADHGNHFWSLQLDDGRVAWMLAKHDVNVGEEVVEAYEKDGKLRVKRPEKENGYKGGGSGGDGKKDPNGLRREAYGSALHAAIQLAELLRSDSHSAAPSSDDIIKVADKFYNATMAKLDL